MAQSQSHVQNSRSDADEQCSTLEDLQNRMSEGVEQVQQIVSDRPAASVALCFGLGFGFGILLSGLLVESMRPRRLSTTERLGQSMMDALSKVLPESISSRMPM